MTEEIVNLPIYRLRLLENTKMSAGIFQPRNREERMVNGKRLLVPQVIVITIQRVNMPTNRRGA